MTRYAIYFVPQQDTNLWRFGCAALGYDSCQRIDVSFHDHEFYGAHVIEELTKDPRRYGFHGTLKPPFALAAGTSIGGLEAIAREFAATRKAFRVDRLVVRAMGNFLALVAEQPSPKLTALADNCVEVFEPFRAPLSMADRERRLRLPLTKRQMENLDRWGYPYVFDDFRFHMTLTGRLPETVLTAGLSALQALYAPIDAPVTFASICICAQADPDARFVMHRRFDFGEAP